MQAADEYLKGVLTEAAKDVHSQPVSDVIAMLRQGKRRKTHAARYYLADAVVVLLLSPKCIVPLNTACRRHDSGLYEQVR